MDHSTPMGRPRADARRRLAGLFRERVESRSGPSRTVFVAAALIGLGLTGLTWDLLRGHPRYAEPIVGLTTWTNTDKDRDYRALAVFLAGTTAAVVGLTGLVRRFSAGPEGPEKVRAATTAIGLSLAPLALWFGQGIAFEKDPHRPVDAVVCLLIVVWSLFALSRHRRELQAHSLFELLGAVLLIDLFGLMAASAPATLLDRFLPRLLASRPWLGWTLLGSGACVALAATTTALARAGDVAGARQRLRRLLLLSQTVLPSLYFVLLPPRILAGHRALPTAATLWLPIALGGVVAIAWFDLSRRARSTSSDLRSVLSPACLGAIAVFAQVRLAGVPRFPRDLFHVGEQVLPWHQWSRFGKVPYVDFIPIHGLMPFLRGAANDLFFQGTATTLPMVDPLLMAAWALATFLAVWAYAGPFAALFITMTMGPSSPDVFDRLYFLVPGLLLLGWSRLTSRPVWWLWAWLGGATFMVAYNFAVGIAYALGTAPIACWFVGRAWREERRALRVFLLLGVAFAVALATWGTSRNILLGFTVYVRENSATNSVLHGVPWSMSWEADRRGPGLLQHPFLMEVARLAWLGCVVMMAWLCWDVFTRDRARKNRGGLIVMLGSIGTLLLLTSWSLGRIDPGQWSRSGGLSAVVVGCLMPAVLLARREPTRAPTILAGLSGVIGLFSTSDARSWADRLHEQALASIARPEGFQLANGREIGLPQVGRGERDQGWLGEHTILKQALAEFLRPGETFLDLTNRSAYYHHLDLPVPSLYAAHFVAGNRATQTRMLHQLRSDPPPVVLVAPATNFDHAPASLRSYHLYREFIDKYVAVERAPFIFLVRPDRVSSVETPRSSAQRELLDLVFASPNLRKLPSSWGNSWRDMADLFEEVETLAPEKLVPVHELTRLEAGRFRTEGAESRLALSLTPRAGVGADYVRFDFQKRNPIRIRLRWTTDDGEVEGPIFEPDGRTLLVPLGAYPSWLLANEVRSMELVILSGGPGTEFTIGNLEFLKLRPIP